MLASQSRMNQEEGITQFFYVKGFYELIKNISFIKMTVRTELKKMHFEC